jgi:hypothetical protein
MLSLTFSRFMGLLILLVTLFLGISVEATTRTVRQDGAGGAFTTIQAALDASVANDIIEIKDGQTYAENLVITLQGLVLRTVAPDPIATISNGLVIHAQRVVVDRLNVTNGGAGITFDQDMVDLLLTDSTVNNCGAQGVSILASTVTLTVQNSSISNNGGKGIDVEDPGSGFERIGTEIRLTDCHVDNNVARNMGWAARNNKGICDATGCTFNAVNEVTERSLEIDAVNWVKMNLVSCTVNGPSGSGFGLNTNGQNVTFRLIDCEINGWSENQVRSTRNAGTVNDIEIKDCVIKGFSTRGMQVRGHIGPLTISNCFFEGGMGDACLRIQEIEVSSEIVFDNITTRKGALGWRFRDNYGSTMTAKDILVEQCENGVLIYRNTDPDVPNSITFEDSSFQNNATGFRFNENVDLVTLNLNDCLIRESEKAVVFEDTNGASKKNKLALAGTTVYTITGTEGAISGIGTDVTAEINLTHSTFHDVGSQLFNLTAGTQFKTLMNLCIVSDWDVNAISNQAAGTFTENYNVFVDANLAGQPVVSGTVARGGNSIDTNDPDAVFCSLDEVGPLFLNIKNTGPAYHIQGTNNAGSKGVCGEPPTAVKNWALFN